MIKAVIFDLDGTLVQTEKMKAQAYAKAVQKLLKLAQPDPRAVEAYRETVGAARDVAFPFPVIPDFDPESTRSPFPPSP